MNASVIFIFITEKNSIFGAYCPLFNTTEEKWISDSNAFIFSINLNKKYPAKNLMIIIIEGFVDFIFKILLIVIFPQKKRSFNKTGIYLNQKELEGNNNEFCIKHFYIYKIDK